MFFLPSNSSYSTWYQGFKLVNLGIKKKFFFFWPSLPSSKFIVNLHCQLKGFFCINRASIATKIASLRTQISYHYLYLIVPNTKFLQCQYPYLCLTHHAPLRSHHHYHNIAKEKPNMSLSSNRALIVKQRSHA